MGHPDLRGRHLVDGGDQGVPVGVVGDHQRQFHPARLGPLAHRHPARRHRHHGIGQPPRPPVGDGAGRGQDQGAAQLVLGRLRGGEQGAEPHALLFIDLAHTKKRAVQVDRRVPAGLAQQGDHPLALSERVAADDVGPIWKQLAAGQQLADFGRGRRVVEHRQRERRLGNEHVAGNRHERVAGGIGRAFVVAADHGAAAPIFHRHLGAAQHMPGGLQPDPDLADGYRLAPGQGLLADRGTGAKPGAHHRQRVRVRECCLVAGAGMVGMAMRDHRPVHGAHGIDEEAAGLAEQALRQRCKPGVGMRHVVLSGAACRP